MLQKTTLKGYTLPLSPQGMSSLVGSPPWYFGGDIYEIAFRVDVETVREFLPYPFELSDNPGLVIVSIMDMTSVCKKEEAFRYPERTQYREFQIKIHCTLNGKKGWFVSNAWVNNDFTLLRGYILGIGKKLGVIHLTKLHEMNPLIGGKCSGAKIKAICETFSSLRIEVSLELVQQVTEDIFAGNTMYCIRHVPDIENPEKPAIHEICELVYGQAQKSDIWECSGEIFIYPSPLEEITKIQPVKVVSARCFKEGYELIGGKVVYRY